MYWISFNDYKNKDFDVEVVQRPNIPAPVKRIESIAIAGRDGSLTVSDGTYEDRIIKVSMNFLVAKKDRFMNTARAVTNWLNGGGILRTSDDPDGFWKVSHASIDESIERILRKAGVFTTSFTVNPYFFFESGSKLSSIEEARLNPYALSMPIYHISGSGNCILTVNGNPINTPVTDNLVINTDLMLMYKENGTPANNATRCEYEKFYLKPGINDISITSGFTLKVQTNWRSL